MKTLVIYDETGYLISAHRGTTEHRQPVGVPFLQVDIPEGKRIKIADGIAVDVSVTPHQVILEDIPPSEIEQLKQTVADLTEIVLSGGM